MKIFFSPSPEEVDIALKRPTKKLKEIKKIVKPIIKRVKERGDKALIKYAHDYDHVDIEDLRTSEEEIDGAESQISDFLKTSIQVAVANIERFHAAQKDDFLEIETMPGVICQRKSVPIESVGLYIPGGSAPLFSTVLMLAIPAKLAGCSNIILCTPPNKKGRIHSAILYAAKITGIRDVFKVGGAQAIAAMAFGTDTIPKVHKIFGPGNQYVTAAKQILNERGVAIDLPAGPSEVAVLADQSSNPEFVASDLLSQAEHGPDSQVLLLTDDKGMAIKINQALEIQLKSLPREKIARQSLENSYCLVLRSMYEAIGIVNRYAPEHLILAIDQAESLVDQIRNAGSVFLGHFTPESVGDYASGTNHTLPTNQAALSYSGVSIDSFVKKITFQKLTEEGLLNIGPYVETMAEAEALVAHKNAISLRLDYIKNKDGSQ